MWVAIKLLLKANWLRLAQIIGLIVGGLGVFFSIRKGGKDAVRAEQQKQTIENVETAHDVRNDVDAMSADARRKRLRDDWSSE